MKKICCSLIVFLGLAATAAAADLTSSGDWTETVDSSDLVAGAGTDLVGQYQSVEGNTTLNVATTAGGNWRITARRADNTWHNQFTLWIKRSSDGAGSGTIIGGSTFIEVTGLDTELCSGQADRSNVGLQFKLTGMSVGVSPALYSTGIIFTVTQ